MSKPKKESTFLNMTLTLTIVAFISSLSLGLTYNLTKDKIKAALEAKKLKAISSVLLKGFSNKPNLDQFNVVAGKKSVECYPGMVDGKISSLAMKVSTNTGFNGNITLMVGLLPDGTINNISVVKQGETPGLGTKIKATRFKKQFIGKNIISDLFKVKKDGGDIDAITAATISSRAYCDALIVATAALKENPSILKEVPSEK